MSNSNNDPILAVLRYALRTATQHNLKDTEGAVYAAAFALFGPTDYTSIATEAGYYLRSCSGNIIPAIFEALSRRMSAGTLGSMRTSAGTQ